MVGGVEGDNWKVAGGAERSAPFVESVWECFVFAQAEVLLDGEVVGGVCLGCAVFRSRVVVVYCWLWRREMLVTDSEMYTGIHGGGVFGPGVPNLMIDRIANPCSIGD